MNVSLIMLAFVPSGSLNCVSDICIKSEFHEIFVLLITLGDKATIYLSQDLCMCCMDLHPSGYPAQVQGQLFGTLHPARHF